MSPWLLLALATGFGLTFMLSLWSVQYRTRDAGIVDFGWSGGLGVVALLFAALGPGDVAHRMALAAMAGLWSFRLASYLLTDRVLKGEEDSRYQTLRTYWGDKAQRNLLFFFLFQGLLIPLFAIPYLMVAQQPPHTFGLWDVIGLVVGIGSVAGESLSDAQLKRWRKEPANRGKTCRTGLWKYSRHPNYFFEWLHWWGYMFLCVGTWQVWPTLMGPVVMLLFLYRITGIPYTERQALKSRGDDYRTYQEEVSPFVPWFPRG